MQIAFMSAGTIKYDGFKGETELGGTENQILGLSREFVRCGHKVHILRRWHGGVDEEEIDGVHIINVKSPNLPDRSIEKIATKMIYSRVAAKIIRKLKPDVVNITGKSSSWGISGLDVPKVHFALYNLDGVGSKSLNPRLLLQRRFELRILHRCNAVVVRNTDSKELLERLGYKATIIPCGVDISRHNPTPSDISRIVYSGRLSKEKGIDLLIRAYSMLPLEKQRKHNVVLYGSGDFEKELIKMVVDYGLRGRIHFRGWKPHQDFIEALNHCGIFVLPSRHEGMPVAMLEAMASEKTVIASDIPGINDIITDEKDGFLFDSGNAFQLKNLLEMLIGDSDLRRETGIRARQTIEADYTFEKIAPQYLELYREVI